jgi:hypothetical protein
VPDTHERPAQHSADATHVCADVRHAQRPAVHDIQPQHWRLEVQPALAAEQQRVDVGAALHVSPVQQAVAGVQSAPETVHIVLVRQRPDSHVSPTEQGDPDAQQD